MIFPKLLIISHNLYDTRNNIGKTLVSLLNGWPKDRLAQIYFRNDPPSFNHCSQYYCITDKEIFKSAMTLRFRKAGKIVSKAEDFSLSYTENSLYIIGNHRHPSVSLVRDCLWMIADWKTSELERWIKDIVKPDLILFVPNDYTLAYHVALHVHKLVNKPIIPFYMDDAFYWKCNTKGIDDLRRKRLRCLAKDIHKNSKEIFTICDYMSVEYKNLFGQECRAFVNSVKVSEPRKNKDFKCPIVFTYLGNLHSNRWKSLAEIGAALNQIEKDKHITCRLLIYSGSFLEEKMESAFDLIPNIEYKGSVPASQVRKIQMDSDVLVHVEAFDEKSVNSTRLSLSTKIPEYLSTGVPVFAYGPDNISSMRYLQDNGLGQVCYSQNNLYDCILDLLSDEVKRNEYAQRGVDRALQYHDIDKVSLEFQDMLIKNCL